MAPQLRAQDIVPPAKKPDSVTVRGTDYWAAVPAQPTRPMPKESILRVDTLRAATRRADGICNYDQKAARAITPTPGSGTRLLPISADPVACRIIVATVDTAKFMQATKRAKPDTLVKPAVIYTYPKPEKAPPPVVKIPAPPVKAETSMVTLIHAPHGALPQFPKKPDTNTVYVPGHGPQRLTKADTAEIRRIALAYLKADSNYIRTVDRRPLHIRGDTAFATFFYGAEVSVVRLEKRDGKWVPTYRGTGVQ